MKKPYRPRGKGEKGWRPLIDSRWIPWRKVTVFTCDYMEIPGLKAALENRGLQCRGACNGKCPWRQPDVVELAREVSAEIYWNRYRRMKPGMVDLNPLINAAMPYLLPPLKPLAKVAHLSCYVISNIRKRFRGRATEPEVAVDDIMTTV